jgi:glycosyltransferase involved in cell wall biosynthesis
VSAVVHVHAGGTEGGGGATYVLALARELARDGDRGLRWRFGATMALAGLLSRAGVEVVELPALPAWQRALWEQAVLARRNGATLLAATNFGPLARRAGYVLVAHNALYFADLPFSGSGRRRLRAEALLARASARRARVVVTPSEAMAGLVRARTGARVRAIPFGPGLAERRVRAPDPRFIFLHRTHWGPHKRLVDLLCAVRELAGKIPGRFVVRTACDPRTPFAEGYANSAEERQLLSDPLVRGHVEVASFALGSVDQVVLAGDAVIVPSATESFSFPLAEAMCFGLPAVAADRPFARELCGAAAAYVVPGDVTALATAMGRLVDGWRPPRPSPEHVRRLSWSAHVDGLATACAEVASGGAVG